MDTITQIIEQANSQSFEGAKNALSLISNTNKSILADNVPTLRQPITEIAQIINRNVMMNELLNQEDITKRISEARQNLPPSLKRQFQDVLVRLRNSKRQKQSIDKALQDIAQAKIALQAGIAKDGSLNPTGTNTKLTILSQPRKTPLEQSLTMFQPMMGFEGLTSTQANNLPPAMQVLERYAEIKGALPVGTVSNQRGSAYVGVKQVELNGTVQYTPFPTNSISKNTPSIASKLQYHANKTINSWNQYVKQEANFVSYYKKVSTPKAREAYLEKQLKQMNIETFSAQALATLVHYYIYIPMRKFATKLRSGQATTTQQSFIATYQVGSNAMDNPLMLTPGQGQTIATSFLTQSLSPSEFLKKMGALILEASNPLNKEKIRTFGQYINIRIAQAKSFMTQNGLQQKLIQKLLANKDWSSVRKQSFIVQNSLQNGQMTSFASKIIEMQEEKHSGTKLFSVDWGSQSVYSHDYVWGQ